MKRWQYGIAEVTGHGTDHGPIEPVEHEEDARRITTQNYPYVLLYRRPEPKPWQLVPLHTARESMMNAMTETPDVAPAKAGMSKGSLFGLLVASLVVGVIFLAMSGGSPSTPAPSGQAGVDKVADSQRACEHYVERALKAPATAKFSSEEVTGADAVWTVTGNVDAENSFSALIRNTFSCTVTLNADGSRWFLTSLTGLT